MVLSRQLSVCRKSQCIGIDLYFILNVRCRVRRIRSRFFHYRLRCQFSRCRGRSQRCFSFFAGYRVGNAFFFTGRDKTSLISNGGRIGNNDRRLVPVRSNFTVCYRIYHLFRHGKAKILRIGSGHVRYSYGNRSGVAVLPVLVYVYKFGGCITVKFHNIRQDIRNCNGIPCRKGCHLREIYLYFIGYTVLIVVCNSLLGQYNALLVHILPGSCRFLILIT